MNNFKIKDWVCVSRLPSFNVFQNQNTAELAQEYVLEVDSQQILQTFLSLSSLNLPQITKLLHFQKFTKYDPVCYSFNSFTIRLFSEFLQSRLKEIGNIPDNYLFQIIYETLIGFENVYRNLRPIKATSNNIGLNKKNQLRIVLYEDLITQHQIQPTQEDVVESVLEVYRSFIPEGMLLPSSMNFTQAIYFIGYRASGPINQLSVPKLTRKQPRFSITQPKDRMIRENVEYYRQELRIEPNMRHIISEQQNSSSLTFSNNSTQREYQNNSQVIKSTFQMNLEQARTTQNNLSVINDLIELDPSHLPLELLDDKKPQYIKLNIMDKILTDDNSDQDLKKMCRMYKHAILYDPVLYEQLKRVRGKTQQIQSVMIRKKIHEVIESKDKYQGLTNRIPNLIFSNSKQTTEVKTERNQRIKKIIQNQKLKMQQPQIIRSFIKPSFHSTNPSPSKQMDTPTMHGQKIKKLYQFKQEAEKILFDF